MWNPVKIGRAVSGMTFNDYAILYIAQGKEDNPGGQNFDCN